MAADSLDIDSQLSYSARSADVSRLHILVSDKPNPVVRNKFPGILTAFDLSPAACVTAFRSS